jgi:hypothetical protein
MFIVHQVCKSTFEDDGQPGLGGGGYFSEPKPVKTFSSQKKAVAYVTSVMDVKDWKTNWSIQKLEVA